MESLVSFSLASDTTGAVENLTLIGFGNLNGVGNALANTLIGNNSANNLNGNSGADLMQGRGGNDSYVVNEAGDVVDESLFGSIGTDEVLSFVSFDLSGPKALGAVENLRLAPGTANLNAHGNALANTLVGNNGVNVITGAAGNDTLTGNGGSDFFVFTTALNAATNVDVIDGLHRRAGHDAAGERRSSPASPTARWRPAPSASGRRRSMPRTASSTTTTPATLFFDRDGTGAAAKVQFATLDTGLAMSNQDFLVV